MSTIQPEESEEIPLEARLFDNTSMMSTTSLFGHLQIQNKFQINLHKLKKMLFFCNELDN